jgi:TolA-binding protein
MSAEVSTAKASASATRAKAAIKQAGETAQKIVVTPESKPIVIELQSQIKQADSELTETQNQLHDISVKLVETSQRVQVQEAQIVTLADVADAAKKETAKETLAKQFWRAMSLKLMALSAGLILWTLRNPIIDLFKKLVIPTL